jgi:polysaccharide biosynthesis protein PslA
VIGIFDLGDGRQRRAGGAFAKQLLDYGLGTMALLFFVPLLLIIALAIKLDSPGPVLFRQKRRGLNNQPFMVFKFRSMYMHLSDIETSRETSRNDPRVTRVGKWLRRLSLDELPQLLNVLRREMSLMGPRPHALNMRIEGELLDVASGDYLLRYSVKPGITGWAQVNGVRGEVVRLEDLRKRIEYDLEYIRRWSVRFDLKILFLTATREIISKNAF